MTGPVVYRQWTVVDGLSLELRGQSADRRKIRLGFVEVFDQETGCWLATVFRLNSASFEPLIRLNCRRFTALATRRAILINASEQFRNDARDGKVKACTK